MPKKVRIPLDVHPDLKEQAKKDSKDVLGRENINGYIKYLIENCKPPKSCWNTKEK